MFSDDMSKLCQFHKNDFGFEAGKRRICLGSVANEILTGIIYKDVVHTILCRTDNQRRGKSASLKRLINLVTLSPGDQNGVMDRLGGYRRSRRLLNLGASCQILPFGVLRLGLLLILDPYKSLFMGLPIGLNGRGQTCQLSSSLGNLLLHTLVLVDVCVGGLGNPIFHGGLPIAKVSAVLADGFGLAAFAESVTKGQDHGRSQQECDEESDSDGRSVDVEAGNLHRNLNTIRRRRYRDRGHGLCSGLRQSHGRLGRNVNPHRLCDSVGVVVGDV